MSYTFVVNGISRTTLTTSEDKKSKQRFTTRYETLIRFAVFILIWSIDVPVVWMFVFLSARFPSFMTLPVSLFARVPIV